MKNQIKFPKNFKIEGIYPPGITTMGNKSYAVAGGKWVEIPEGTEVKDIMPHWINTMPKSIKQSGNKNDYNKKFEAPSSKGDKNYTVQIDDNGNYTCTCPGYGFRRKCRHILEIKNKIKL